MSIIEQIYESLLDDEAFDALPARLADLVGARSTTLQTIVDQVPVHVATHYFSEAMGAFYAANDIIKLDPWIPIVTGKKLLNRAADSDDHLSRRDFENSAFYNEFFRRFGDDTGVSLGAVIETRDGFVGLGLHRALTAPRFDLRERAALEAALPHLRRLAETRSRLRETEGAVRDLRAVLHAQAVPVLLTDATGRIHFANAAAEEMLVSGDGLWSHQGVLRVAGAQVQRLARALADAAGSRGSGDAILVARPSARPAYRVVVAPHRGPGALPGRAMVVIEDPVKSNAGLVDCLRHLFRLSPAEADLAVHLAEGCSLGDVAGRRNVQASTVRSQLNSVLAKTGLRRQSELTAMISRLPRLRPS